MTATAPDPVGQQAQEFFAETQALTAERFAEARIDPDRGLRVTIIELDDDDIAAITAVARRLGVTDWVRIERANPADLAAWERLRHELRELWGGPRGVLLGSPTTAPGYRRPPVSIRLGAGAEATAAHLHATYGAFVELRVGALPYPPAAATSAPAAPGPGELRTALAAPTADPARLRIEPDGPLTVRSGDTTTLALLLTNLADHDIEVRTNGRLTARIVDDSGAVVGGYSGFQHQPLRLFRAAPAETVRIPLLIGTAGYRPEIGYVIPAGTWQLVAALNLGDIEVLTPRLELTVTD